MSIHAIATENQRDNLKVSREVIWEDLKKVKEKEKYGNYNLKNNQERKQVAFILPSTSSYQ